MRSLPLLLVTCLIFSFNLAQSQRYLTPVFSNATVTPDIPYGSAINYQGNNQVLTLDLYEPANDTLTKRPLLLYLHGGGFTDTNQTKSLVHIAAYCDSLARRGYLAASANYRLDTSISNRAIIHAMHDARAAIRFFKSQAAVYGVDTALIFIAGESAGAVTSLNVSYVDTPAEVLFPTALPMATDLTVEGNSGNPGFRSSTKATLAFCGGSRTVLNDSLFDPAAIDDPNDPPLVMVHGTSDPLIPIAAALEVALQANQIGLPNLFFALDTATHCPWFFPLPNSWAYLDTLIDSTVPFLYACVNGSTVALEAPITSPSFSIAPNPTPGRVLIKAQGNGPHIVQVVDLYGRIRLDQSFSSHENTFDLSALGKGIYWVRIMENDQWSKMKQVWVF